MEKPVTPAVSVALINGGSVLLVKRGREPSKGQFAFPGGRVEPGETLEQAARRELMEETGLQAGPLTLAKALDIDAPPFLFRLHVFVAPYLGGTPRPGDDAEEADWYPLDRLSGLPLSESVLEVATAALTSAPSSGSAS